MVTTARTSCCRHGAGCRASPRRPSPDMRICPTPPRPLTGSGRNESRRVVTVLGNGGGNETLRDQARQLRYRGRHGRQQRHWPAQRHPVETSETALALFMTQRAQVRILPPLPRGRPQTKILRGPFSGGHTSRLTSWPHCRASWRIGTYEESAQVAEGIGNSTSRHLTPNRLHRHG